MSVPMTVLGLVDIEPRHGYELRRTYDAHFAGDRPLKTGYLYSTLNRLERDALIEQASVDRASGPDRTVFAATEAGHRSVQEWLATPVPDAPYLQSVVFAKVLIALMAGRSARAVVDIQRSAHLVLMREWTVRRREAPTTEATISADYVLFHLDADLRWLDATERRLDQLEVEVAR